MGAAIEARDVRKHYGGQRSGRDALVGASLVVEPGEFVAIMGPSGCGKSTLLHLLAGLDTPTSGEVWIDGERIDTLTESGRAVLRRRTVGYVFQTWNLVPNLTVAANLELPGMLLGQRRRSLRSRRDELLESLGLAHRAKAFPRELSGGEQQRVALARALVNRPVVVLADEPTGNLDSANGEAVLDLLGQVNAAGQTIVLVTHDPNVAARASRTVHMADGLVVDR